MVKLNYPFRVRLAWLRLALKMEIERYCSADEVPQGCLIDLVAFVDVDGAPDVSFEARVEQTRRVLERSSLGKCQLDDVLVRLSGADNAAMRKDRSAGRCGLRPFPLFDDLRVGFVYDRTHFRKRFPTPVPKFPDLLVELCRSRLHVDSPPFCEIRYV